MLQNGVSGSTYSLIIHPNLASRWEPGGCRMTSLVGGNAALSSASNLLFCLHRQTQDLPLSSVLEPFVGVAWRKGNFPWLDWRCSNWIPWQESALLTAWMSSCFKPLSLRVSLEVVAMWSSSAAFTKPPFEWFRRHFIRTQIFLRTFRSEFRPIDCVVVFIFSHVSPVSPPYRGNRRLMGNRLLACGLVVFGCLFCVSVAVAWWLLVLLFSIMM